MRNQIPKRDKNKTISLYMSLTEKKTSSFKIIFTDKRVNYMQWLTYQIASFYNSTEYKTQLKLEASVFDSPKAPFVDVVIEICTRFSNLVPRPSLLFLPCRNLVPRVLRLLGQRFGRQERLWGNGIFSPEIRGSGCCAHA